MSGLRGNRCPGRFLRRDCVELRDLLRLAPCRFRPPFGPRRVRDRGAPVRGLRLRLDLDLGFDCRPAAVVCFGDDCAPAAAGSVEPGCPSLSESLVKLSASTSTAPAPPPRSMNSPDASRVRRCSCGMEVVVAMASLARGFWLAGFFRRGFRFLVTAVRARCCASSGKWDTRAAAFSSSAVDWRMRSLSYMDFDLTSRPNNACSGGS